MAKASKKRVAGYWVYKTPKGKAPVTYYVKAHLRKRPPVKPKARKPPKGYVVSETYDIIADEETIVYTYKISALVEYQHKYVVRFSLDKDVEAEIALEFYHSKFEPTVALATADFHRQMQNLMAMGHVIEFQTIELWMVIGVGKLRDKRWKKLKSFRKISDVK